MKRTIYRKKKWTKVNDKSSEVEMDGLKKVKSG
jgi:hypothetical protein